MRLKRFLPRSLFGRALLIVALPVLLLQGVVAYVFIQRHYDGASRQMTDGVGQALAHVVAEIEAAPDWNGAQDRLAALSRAFDIGLSLSAEQDLRQDAIRRFYDLSGGAVAEALRSRLDRPVAVDLVTREKTMELRAQTDKGVLIALVDRRRLSPSNPHQLLVATFMSSLALLAVAVQFLRNQVRPIRQLAAAASAFGVGHSLRFHPSGADEVRRAGRAFLAMRARIERQIESRTRMLSGVSHDMRTPLTRMKLALAMMEPGPETDALSDDIAALERMLDEFLAFARDEASEDAAPTDLAALVAELAEESRRGGAAVTLGPVEDVALTLRRGALKRALANLMDNAARHASRQRLSVVANAASVSLCVEDDGPGIDSKDHARALAPFSRLDAARNQDRGGGVGLGLAIAQDIARSHGGRLELLRSEDLGGLAARITLPR